jgi:hypothetical protein
MRLSSELRPQGCIVVEEEEYANQRVFLVMSL